MCQYIHFLGNVKPHSGAMPLMAQLTAQLRSSSLCHYAVSQHNTNAAALTSSVADLIGARGTHAPPGGPNSFNFMQFWENLANSYVGAPPKEGWCPHLGKIVDPPLITAASSPLHKKLSDITRHAPET